MTQDEKVFPTAPSRRLIVIGGVAAGTKAAVKAKRDDPGLDVTILEAGEHISYAGCGLPYYVGEVIKKESALLVRKPKDFFSRDGVRVLTHHRVIRIVPSEKKLVAVNDETGDTVEHHYDILVLATGASAVRPPLPGSDLHGVFTLRRYSDAVAIKRLVSESRPNAAVVVGGGPIGLETAENLVAVGVKVHLIELMDQVVPGFDEDIARIVENDLRANEVNVLTGQRVTGFAENANGNLAKVRTEAGEIPAQMAILAIGVRPNVELAKEAGIRLGPTGAILVNRKMETSVPGIYAVGDCSENVNLVTRLPAWYPMGSTANKMGRVAGINAARTSAEDVSDALEGVLGTSILKVFGINAARTGLSEGEAKAHGFDPVVVTVPVSDRAHYYPDHKMIVTRLVADRQTHKVLGAQIVGEGIVDKPVDILVTAITLGARVEDLVKMDFAYAPPFSSAMSSTIVAANVMLNRLSGRNPGIDAKGLHQEISSGKTLQLLDVRTEAEYSRSRLKGSINVPLGKLKEGLASLDPQAETVIICRSGLRAYLASLLLQRSGFRRVRMLDGGLIAYPYETEN